MLSEGVVLLLAAVNTKSVLDDTAEIKNTKSIIDDTTETKNTKSVIDSKKVTAQSDSTIDKQWVIAGKAYDLTKFLDFHPGGSHILNMNQGRDCTELFFSYHLASDKKMAHIESMMSKYCIGDASSSQIGTPFNWNGKNYEIYLDFKSRIQSYFNENKHIYPNRGKAPNSHFIFNITLFISLLIAYKYCFDGYWISLPILSLIHWLLSSSLLHDGTHYALVKNANTNQLLSLLGGFFHSPNIQWEMQHVVSHHSYTNINGLDIDLNHFLDAFRTTVQQNWQSNYSMWRYIMPIYILLTSIGQIDAWSGRMERHIHRLIPFWKNGSMTSRYALIVYFCQCSWIFFIMPLVMYWQFGLLKGGAFMMLPRVGHGILFYVFSQVSHIQSDAFSDDDLEHDSWIKHQIESCVDYSVTSLFWNYMSIGLNNQAFHHLTPSIHPLVYSDEGLQSVLDKFCADYGFERNVYPNLWVTLLSHFKHLGKVNDNDNVKLKNN